MPGGRRKASLETELCGDLEEKRFGTHRPDELDSHGQRGPRRSISPVDGQSDGRESARVDHR